MHIFKNDHLLRQIAIILVVSMALISIVPQVDAAFISSEASFSDNLRQQDTATIKKVLEQKLIKQRLQALGYSGDEVKTRLKEPAYSLSIGQQQRLCLARGLAVDPDIILADEPTSALDPISSQEIEKKFIELKKGYTIVLVTHILRQAIRLADYVIFMYLGEVIEHGPAEQFFKSPRTEITRAYLKGSIN